LKRFLSNWVHHNPKLKLGENESFAEALKHIGQWIET